MKFEIKKISLQFYFGAIVLVGLGGCASFDREKMIVQDYEASNHHPYTVSLSVGSGDEESDVGLVPIPRQDLQYAIEESIRKGQVFQKIVSGKEGDFLLNVTVFALEQPSMGFSMTTKLEAGWTLTKAGGDIVWQEVIKSKHTTGATAAFAGTTRMRMANDGAIRENIRQGMLKLSDLNI